MALTATASNSVQKHITRLLGMSRPQMVIRSPDKPNIYYSVSEKCSTLEEIFKPLIEELRVSRINTKRTIVFCRTLKDCSDLYLFFRYTMGKEFTEPIGVADFPIFRLVDMFSACNTPGLKQSILSSFSNPSGILRIVIATIAFGMGIDAKLVGRAGRDGSKAYAELLFSKRDTGVSFMEPSMKSYCQNVDVCRREVLFRDFEIASLSKKPLGCLCCDICAIVCSCSDCQFNDCTV